MAMADSNTHGGIWGDHGLNKCPRYGSAEIVVTVGKRVCKFCRYEWAPKLLPEHSTNDLNIVGRQVGFGAKDTDPKFDLVTIKCQSCGGEVMINTSQKLETRVPLVSADAIR